MLSQASFSSPLINEDLPAGPQLVFTLNNRFFRHQACYSLLPAKPGGEADRVISLCKYKVVAQALARTFRINDLKKVNTYMDIQTVFCILTRSFNVKGQ